MDNDLNDASYGKWRVRSQRLARRQRRKELEAERPRKAEANYVPPLPPGYAEQHEQRILAEQARVEREMAELIAAGKEIT